MQCSLCEQLVLNPKEQKNKRPLCYYHSKVKAGLISKSHLSDADINFMERDKLRKKYLGYPKHIINKFVPKNLIDEVGFESLESVAHLALLRVCTNTESSSTYIFSHIKGAVLNYVRQHKSQGLSGISHRKYWQWVNGELDLTKDTDAAIFTILSGGVTSLDASGVGSRVEDQEATPPLLEPTETLYDVLPADDPNPEALLLIKEAHEKGSSAASKHRHFVVSLSKVERIVWHRFVLARKTTRSIALEIEQSRTTVSNIAKRVRLKFLNYWFPDKGAEYEFYKEQIK